jgi:hypothetical protein
VDSQVIGDALAGAIVFAVIFVLGHRFHLVRSRRVALSFGAGVSISYVFIQMLPELGEAGRVFVRETADLGLPMPELRIYLSALVGFLVFYGLEHMLRWSRRQGEGTGGEVTHERWMSHLHIVGFAAYVWLVAYLMVRGITEEAAPILLYALAMGLHFLAVDHSLQREHGELYLRVGRFVLAGASLAGWACALAIAIPKPMLVTGLGLVSGGVVMNSMIAELPDDKDGRFWPFVAGAVMYSGLLLLMAPRA